MVASKERLRRVGRGAARHSYSAFRGGGVGRGFREGSCLHRCAACSYSNSLRGRGSGARWSCSRGFCEVVKRGGAGERTNLTPRLLAALDMREQIATRTGMQTVAKNPKVIAAIVAISLVLGALIVSHLNLPGIFRQRRSVWHESSKSKTGLRSIAPLGNHLPRRLQKHLQGGGLIFAQPRHLFLQVRFRRVQRLKNDSGVMKLAVMVWHD